MSSFIFYATRLKTALYLIAILRRACWNSEKFMPMKYSFGTILPFVRLLNMKDVSFGWTMMDSSKMLTKFFQASKMISLLCFFSVREKYVFWMRKSYRALRFASNFVNARLMGSLSYSVWMFFSAYFWDSIRCLSLSSIFYLNRLFNYSCLSRYSSYYYFSRLAFSTASSDNFLIFSICPCWKILNFSFICRFWASNYSCYFTLFCLSSSSFFRFSPNFYLCSSMNLSFCSCLFLSFTFSFWMAAKRSSYFSLAFSWAFFWLISSLYFSSYCNFAKLIIFFCLIFSFSFYRAISTRYTVLYNSTAEAY